ncbi:MAG: peptide ABC transporter substrate-binding protein [Treponema sp.]|jgi:oligopeptide transport system substrate-binding protein|nr:peptide ABC transporter substrate-binding protein [Treponema sp.]
MKRLLIGLNVFVLMVVLAFSAYGAGRSQGQSQKTLSKVLNWVAPGEVTTMDSGKGYDTISWEQIEIFTESLYEINENNEPVPALAADMPTVSADGLTLTIHLKPNIAFSNGVKITADDFVYAAQRIVDPATGSQSANRITYLKNAADIIAGKQPPENLGIRALSDSSLEITLVAPNPYINTELSSSLMAPVSRAFVREKGVNYGLSAENLLASGPFILTGWNGANISWKYVKNPYYWDAKNVYFDEINIQVVKDAATGVALYEAGTLDAAAVAGEYLTAYRGTPDLVSVKTLRMTNLELGISSNQYLKNINLRKALLLAVDRDELAQSILNGDGIPAVGIIPNGIAVSPGSGKSIAEDFGVLVSTNISEAQRFFAQALRELGVSSITLRLVTTDNDEGIKTGQYLQSVYETNLPGLKIDLANVPASVRFQEMMAYKFDLALGGWTGEFNPATYIKQFETSNEHNHGRWVSPEITTLINALETSDGINFALRWEHLREANKYLIDNVVTVPLVQAAKSYLINPKLKGYVIHVLGTPIDITRAYFE